MTSFPNSSVFPHSFTFLQPSRHLPKQPGISLHFLQAMIKQAKARVQGWCWPSAPIECGRWGWRDPYLSCCWNWACRTPDRCSWGGLSWRTCGWTKRSDSLRWSWFSKTHCRFAKKSSSCQRFPPSPRQAARRLSTSHPVKRRPLICQWIWYSYPQEMH